MFQAQEYIKREMVTMLHHDSLANPTLPQQGHVPGSKKSSLPQGQLVVNQDKHVKHLQTNPLQTITPEEMVEVMFHELYSCHFGGVWMEFSANWFGFSCDLMLSLGF